MKSKTMHAVEFESVFPRQKLLLKVQDYASTNCNVWRLADMAFIGSNRPFTYGLTLGPCS